jgi:hypothetical protein
MDTLLQLLTLATAFVSLIALIDMAVSLRGLRLSFDRARSALRTTPYTNVVGIHEHSPGGNTIWVFRRGRWEVDATDCQPGYEPGLPPQFQGPFEGYRVRQPCRPERKA